MAVSDNNIQVLRSNLRRARSFNGLHTFETDFPQIESDTEMSEWCGWIFSEIQDFHPGEDDVNYLIYSFDGKIAVFTGEPWVSTRIQRKIKVLLTLGDSKRKHLWIDHSETGEMIRLGKYVRSLFLIKNLFLKEPFYGIVQAELNQTDIFYDDALNTWWFEELPDITKACTSFVPKSNHVFTLYEYAVFIGDLSCCTQLANCFGGTTHVHPSRLYGTWVGKMDYPVELGYIIRIIQEIESLKFKGYPHFLDLSDKGMLEDKRRYMQVYATKEWKLDVERLSKDPKFTGKTPSEPKVIVSNKDLVLDVFGDVLEILGNVGKPSFRRHILLKFVDGWHVFLGDPDVVVEIVNHTRTGEHSDIGYIGRWRGQCEDGKSLRKCIADKYDMKGYF